MKSLLAPCLAAACWMIPPQEAVAQRTFYSQPELASQSVGLLETQVRNGFYRGSGTVARDERIIYSCAHLVYDSGIWAKDYTFHRAWHDRRYPSKRLGASPRGFHYFTQYARSARFNHGESNASFANDFTVFYGNRPFGPIVNIQENSAALLRSGTGKRIIGYPSRIDFTGKRGFSYQHSTGWFPNRAYQVRGGFHEYFGVSTGSGNSGGGIFLRDPATGEDLLAGILVSGGFRTAGVVAMDRSTNSLASQAIGSSLSAFNSANASRMPVSPTRRVLSRSLPVPADAGTVASLSLDLDLRGIRDGTPSVFLQSPGGRIRRVAVPEAEAGMIRIRNQKLDDAFRGADASGAWQVRVLVGSDAAATFERAWLRGDAAK